ncbi:MAG TPA: S8 family serine peptidase, partial [Hyphomonadaceae bacterium]|nr:S8 family serine peptidase [Hyphomonadaceae bacterium]
LERGVEVKASDLNRLNATMSEKNFREMFSTKLVKQMSDPAAKAKGPAKDEQSEFLAPEAIEVPDSLKDTIAFAYVPRPVEYHAQHVLALPPTEHLYYLRLGDVATALNAKRCHASGWTGQNIKVAMVDTGFYPHPYFVRAGYSLLPTPSPGSGAPDVDLVGHGTGESANIFAIAPRCTVYGVKQGNSAASDLETAIAQKPHVITNSWGWSIDTMDREQLRRENPNMFNELIDVESVVQIAIEENEITVVFSAGNGHLSYPACLPDVIAAGGVTLNEDGSLEASSYASGFDSKLYAGRKVPDVCGLVGRLEAEPMSAHIMLPVPPTSELDGDNFPSKKKGTGWGIFSGTSAAAPQVAGVVALLKQIDGKLKPQQIKQVLALRAVDIVKGKTATGAKAAAGVDLATGAGLVDALRACGYASGIP